jgi:beta-glucanase (GH16 family)
MLRTWWAGVAVVSVALSACSGTAAPSPWPSTVDSAAVPVGQPAGAWDLVFADEFDGTELDAARWDGRSGAEADEGRGNRGNQQLEWNTEDNCRVAGGELVMTARREEHVSEAGERYEWTSCLISSAPSFAFQYGYVEERAVLPAESGFWPAFWTWQAPEVDRQVETDVYEQYSADTGELQMTQHSGEGDGCRWRPPFDPSAGWHTYAVAIEASGTVWYVDGVQVCHRASTSDGRTNIVSNLAVYAKRPPGGGTATATKRVEHIRAWARR